MPYTPRQKAALIQALNLLGGLFRGSGRGIPGLTPGLTRGRPLVPPDKGFIGIPNPVLPPGLSRGRVGDAVRFLPSPIERPGGPLPPGLSRGRGDGIGFRPSPIERPGGPLPPTLGGRDHVLTKAPGGGTAPLPRNPGDGEFRAF